MKRFKLLKNYPNAPCKVGEIIHEIDYKAEEYPEFWQEILEERKWEVLSFKGLLTSNNGLFIKKWDLYYYNGLNFSGGIEYEHFFLEKNVTTIHSIRKLTDNLILTVGDRIKIDSSKSHYHNMVQEIKSFHINENGNLCIDTNLTNKNGLSIENKIQKVIINYEILTFSKDGHFFEIVNTYDCKPMHHNYPLLLITDKLAYKAKIHSIKRLSDSEIFTIGDTVSGSKNWENKSIKKIKGFQIEKGEAKVLIEEGNSFGVYPFDNLMYKYDYNNQNMDFKCLSINDLIRLKIINGNDRRLEVLIRDRKIKNDLLI